MLAVFIANIKVLVHTHTLYSLSVFIAAISIVAYFLLELFFNYLTSSCLFNILTRILQAPTFYYVFVLILFLTVGLDLAWVVFTDHSYMLQIASIYKN